MKANCAHCHKEVRVNILKPIRDEQCPDCRRLLFREERVWGWLWSAVCVVVGFLVGKWWFDYSADMLQAWTAYLIYLLPVVTVAVIAPLGNVLKVIVHQAKQKK